jgi:hypothetical protein
LRDPDGDTDDIFFPKRGETSEAAVLKFCLKCTVRDECDAYATEHDVNVGIWGGKRRTKANMEVK